MEFEHRAKKMGGSINVFRNIKIKDLISTLEHNQSSTVACLCEDNFINIHVFSTVRNLNLKIGVSMRLPKRYLRRVMKKRLIEFILMFSVISIVLFGVFMVGARSGTGLLYQYRDNWHIDSKYRNNHNYFF